MSDSFDPSAIAEGVFLRHDIGVAAKLNRRLIDCDHHDELYAQFDKLEGVPGTRHRKPNETLGPTTIYVFGKDGEQNLQLKQTLESCSVKYHFPDGLTVTKLRKAPLTFRLDDETGRQLIIRRQRDSSTKQLFWEVMSKSGFSQHSGKRAGTRIKGRGADRSFD
jgi:hypothetical protein